VDALVDRLHFMNATYVFCVVAASRPPRVQRGLRGLAGMGPVRLLPIERGLAAIVADAPLSRYGEPAVNRGLSNLDWVSRAAVAHEGVVERFSGARAVLPMKLFTMFANDERAVAYFRGERRRLLAAAKRVANQQEWGIRVLLDRARAAASRGKSTRARAGTDGVTYLAKKKAQRDAVAELALRARETVAQLYDRLAANATDARQRPASELPPEGGSLLLDAAFLVPRRVSASFTGRASRVSRSLAPHGYSMTLTGPWPPYTFVREG
jgi:hypothetical protein